MPNSTVPYFETEQPFITMPCWYNPNIIATATNKFGRKEYLYENKFGIYREGCNGKKEYFVRY